MARKFPRKSPVRDTSGDRGSQAPTGRHFSAQGNVLVALGLGSPGGQSTESATQLSRRLCRPFRPHIARSRRPRLALRPGLRKAAPLVLPKTRRICHALGNCRPSQGHLDSYLISSPTDSAVIWPVQEGRGRSAPRRARRVMSIFSVYRPAGRRSIGFGLASCSPAQR